MARFPEPAQMLRLNLEQAGFHGGGSAQPPQGARQPEDELPLDRGLRIIVGNDSGLERFVILGIFEGTDHRLGREPMADGIAAGTLFALFGNWAGAFASVAAVGFELPEGSHCGSARIIGFVLYLDLDFVPGTASLASCSRNGLQSLFGDQREQLERGAAWMFLAALPLAHESGGDVEVAGKYSLARLLA